MITIRRSDTGAWVLVHEPSQTVVVGDDLEATYAQLQQHLQDQGIAGHGAAALGPLVPPVAPRRPWAVGLWIVALLPFVWLAVLHYTLGQLLDDLRAAVATDPAAPPVEVLRGELEALRQEVTRLEAAVDRSRPAATAARLPPPPRAVDRTPEPAEDDPDHDDDESGDDAD